MKGYIYIVDYFEDTLKRKIFDNEDEAIAFSNEVNGLIMCCKER